jgi:hypothetical protein
MRVCSRGPYTWRDLADRYDPEAALQLCATCNVEDNQRKTQRGRTCPSTTINVAELHAAPYATEASASFATIAAAPLFVQGNASSVSRSAGKATAIGYGDFELPRTEADVTQRYPGNRSFRTGS